MTELYEFKEKYPEVDVEPFIAKTSQFFRNYVERGLKAIEKERKSSSNISSSKPIIFLSHHFILDVVGVSTIHTDK